MLSSSHTRRRTRLPPKVVPVISIPGMNTVVFSIFAPFIDILLVGMLVPYVPLSGQVIATEMASRLVTPECPSSKVCYEVVSSRVYRGGSKDVDRSWLHLVYSVQRNNTSDDITLNGHLSFGESWYGYFQPGPIF